MLEASRPWSMKGKSQRCATAKPRFIVQSLPNNFVMDESFPAINAAIIPRMAVSASPTANKSTLFESSTNSKKATPRQGTAKSVVLMEPNNAIITSSMDSTGLYVGSAIIEKRPDFKFRGVSARTDAKRPVTSEAILFPRIQRMQHRVKELEGFIVEDIVS